MILVEWERHIFENGICLFCVDKAQKNLKIANSSKTED